MNHLSLFTGYGGFDLGLRLAGLPIRTVMYVEWERYPQEILKARIKDKQGTLDDAPIWADISTLDGTQLRGVVDAITAGFPCQPHSVAGKKLGSEDERNLWPDTLRIISEVGPKWVMLENVPGLATSPKFGIKVLEAKRQLGLFDQEDKESNPRGINRSNHTVSGYSYMGRIIGELSELGYDTEWGIVSAAEAGALHLRKRWWCLAHKMDDSEHDGRNGSQESGSLGSRVYPSEGEE